MSNLFLSALNRQNKFRPPVWFMRQAGRYHSHYQTIRKKHDFMEICKNPAIATEVTVGPINDFDFDAAILFSDLLFPLESMGMGLSYRDGPPKLDWYLKKTTDLKRLKSGAELKDSLLFQSEAVKQIKAILPKEKGFIGFVGGPLTLYCYATCGSHQGSLEDAKVGLKDGRYLGFIEKLEGLLIENMLIQASSGVDVIAVLDTCAGEFSVSEFKEFGLPSLKRVFNQYLKQPGAKPILYYTKGTDFSYWDLLTELPIKGIGVDWKQNIIEVLERYSDIWAIQGNFNPNLMLETNHDFFQESLELFFNPILKIPHSKLKGWICGLGHGILQKTPEENVRKFIAYQREIFK